jgi:pimeloyl-ACP methyl ester carboxylesterase
MPYICANGIQLAYQRSGRGDPVVMIMGQSAGGNVWTTYQVPALTAAGYEAITFDNRGIPPSDAPPGDYSLADLVADTAGLIEGLKLGPCRLVGTSMGAFIATELAVGRPDLVTSCVLIAVRSRADALRRALSAGERAVACGGVPVPPSYEAPVWVLQMLSPVTLNNDTDISMWLDIREMTAGSRTAATGQTGIDLTSDRRELLRAVPVPCRVIGFSDDLLCPPHLCAEVADAIPDCDYVQLSSCGHLGYLERPDEVNAAIIEFLDKN